MTDATAAPRSHGDDCPGGLPELVVEDSPAAADVALLEEQVAAAAIAASGLREEQEFGIFARGDDGRNQLVRLRGELSRKKPGDSDTTSMDSLARHRDGEHLD